MDRALLVASTICFLFGFAYTMYALGAGRFRPSRFNFAAIFAGFLLQTAFLYRRGEQIGRCPLTNLFEVLIFLSWSIVLLYLLVGPTYRLSLLGAFTSPLVLLLHVFALMAPIDLPAGPKIPPDPWLELHAALSIIAYGAFAMACVAGVMYLAQERQLKTHHIRSLFYNLPPISNLAAATNRLLLCGFLLLTAGLLAGFVVGAPLAKVLWGIAVWFIYGGILQAGKLRWISPRRVAMLSVLAFTLTLSTLWGLNFLSAKHP